MTRRPAGRPGASLSHQVCPESGPTSVLKASGRSSIGMWRVRSRTTVSKRAAARAKPQRRAERCVGAGGLTPVVSLAGLLKGARTGRTPWWRTCPASPARARGWWANLRSGLGSSAARRGAQEHHGGRRSSGARWAKHPAPCTRRNTDLLKGRMHPGRPASASTSRMHPLVHLVGARPCASRAPGRRPSCRATGRPQPPGSPPAASQLQPGAAMEIRPPRVGQFGITYAGAARWPAKPR